MRKTLLSFVITTSLLLSVVPFSFAQDIAPLTNTDILTIVLAKRPTALIIEKINTSSCTVDTFPSVLAELKYKGVPDEVLMVMVQTPHGGRATAGRKSLTSQPATNEAPTVLT